MSCSIMFFMGKYLSRPAENFSKEIKMVILEKKGFTWIKKDKEISIQGKLFDVTSFKEQEGKIVFTGFFDEQEDELFAFLHSISSEDKSDFAIKHQLLAFVFFPATQLQNSAILNNPENIEKQKICQAPDTLLLHRASEIDDPPPNKFCLFI